MYTSLAREHLQSFAKLAELCDRVSNRETFTDATIETLCYTLEFGIHLNLLIKLLER